MNVAKYGNKCSKMEQNPAIDHPGSDISIVKEHPCRIQFNGMLFAASYDAHMSLHMDAHMTCHMETETETETEAFCI